jgi:hypothetical protein
LNKEIKDAFNTPFNPKSNKHNKKQQKTKNKKQKTKNKTNKIKEQSSSFFSFLFFSYSFPIILSLF